MEEAEFNEFVLKGISEGRADPEFRLLTQRWMEISGKYGYSYRQRFLGVPIIQLPGDMVAVQSLIFDIKPDIIIETGIARGGSLVMSATFLALIDIYAGQYGTGESNRRVIGIDQEIRPHTRHAINACPFKNYITMLEGDSNAEHIVGEVESFARKGSTVVVFLDSNHTQEHVYKELVNYSKLVSINSYIVVFDTSIEFNDPGVWADRRPWGKGNSPHSALMQFINSEHGRDFSISNTIDDSVEMTVCHNGFLKRIQ